MRKQGPTCYLFRFVDLVVQLHYSHIVDLHAYLDSLLFFLIHAEEKYVNALYPWLLYKYFQLQSKCTVLYKAETYMGGAEVAIIRDLKGWNVPKDL